MRKSITPLGETEMEILHHVWDLKEATVADVHDKILIQRKVAYTTVMTVMKNLTKKGFLQFRKDGVTYVYSAAEKPEHVQSNIVAKLVDKVFKGSASALIQTLVKQENISEAEKLEIKKLIDDLEEDQ